MRKAAQQPQQSTGQVTAAAVATKNTQEWKDLMIVLKNCNFNLSDAQAEKFAEEQGIAEISDLMHLTAEEKEMDMTITTYNKNLDAADAHLRIKTAIPPNRLQALVHSHRVQVWALANLSFSLEAHEWSTSLQASRGVQEYKAFLQRQREKSNTEPTAFPAELKPELFREDGERVHSPRWRPH